MTLIHSYLICFHKFNTSDWKAVNEVDNQINTMSFKHNLNTWLQRHGFPNIFELQNIRQLSKLLLKYKTPQNIYITLSAQYTKCLRSFITLQLKYSKDQH